MMLATMALPASVIALPDSNQIEFSNCSLALPGTNLTASARCGTYDVAENPADPDGQKINLKVAIAPATGKNTEPDPVFFFAGGPGQAASETWVIIQSTLRKDPQIPRHRDDRSARHGRLQQTGMRDPNSKRTLTRRLISIWSVRRPRNAWPPLMSDPRFYTTSIAMGDYNQVRQAMGYDKINIMGVSYGTRAAQVYLRLFPEAVRSSHTR